MNLLQQIFFFLVFLFPVATYLATLSAINRREHPFMISGVWDSVGLVMACSGFLVGAGPAILSAFYDENVRILLTQDPANPLNDFFWGQWWLFWGLYYGIVIAGSAGLLYLRRNSTVIYNIEPRVLDGALTQVFERLGLAWSRQGNTIFLRRPATVAAEEKIVEERIQANPVPNQSVVEGVAAKAVAHPAGEMTLHVDTFPALYNATLRWSGPAQDLREDIVADLYNVFETAHTRGNPCSGWFFGIACVMYLVMFFTVSLMVLFTLWMAVR